MFASQKKYLFETPSNIVFERKLDTALRRSTVDNFFARVKDDRLTFDDRLITESALALSGLPSDVKTTGFTDILSLIIQQSDAGERYMTPRDTTFSQVRQRACTDATQIQIDLLLKNYELPNKEEIQRNTCAFLNNTKDSLFLSNLMVTLRDLTSAIERSHEINNRKYSLLPEDTRLEELLKVNYYYDPRDLFRCCWSRNLILLVTSEGCYVYPKQYLVLIHNKLADLASVIMLTQYHAGTALPRHAMRDVLAFLNELMMLHYQYDTQYFMIAKSLEALCIAETLIEADDWNNDEFLNAISMDLIKDPGFKYRTSALRRLIRKAPSAFRHELCCLSKILGHPLVRMLEGSVSLHEATNASHVISPLRIVDCINHVKENYIRNYILRFGAWPPAHISNINCSQALKEAWAQGVDPNSRIIKQKYGPVPLDEYVHVEILPCMRFDYLHNSIDHIKDKTITLLRSEVVARYLNGDYTGRAASWEDTRLLLFYLMHDKASSDHVKFIKQYEATGDLDSLIDYMVIRIVPKEKELKEKFRGFGCQTFMSRLRCLTQEKSAMHYLDLFCDEQAMTLNELELIKKLYALRTIKRAYPGHTPIYISIDASKWNNHFRAETVDNVMKHTLDKVFDTTVFGKTHAAYQKTLFYVPDAEETYWWEGQAGGIEGLNQDTWVVTYLAQIKVAMKSFDFKYQAFCKGDDFRLVVLIPPNIVEQIPLSQLKTNIVTEVSRVAQDFGHEVKILESYGSCTYFSFSKAASLGVIEYPQGFRKIQKCYGANNAFIPTLDEYIGAAFSNAHSACATEPQILGCYMVALKWASFYILLDESYKDISTPQLTALLLTPSLVGGFPIIYLHNMAVRFESDLLPPYLMLLQHTVTEKPSVYKYMSNFLRIPIKKPETIVPLCKDPYSLPGDRPNLPSIILRKMLFESLRSMIRHEDLLSLYKAYDSGYTEKIEKCLRSANVYNPKVFSLIYSSTPTGQIEELTRKFESSRSVHEVLVLRRGKRRADGMLRRVIRAERKLQRWRRGRMDRVNTRGTHPILHLMTDCPAESAQRMREYAWGKPVEGITTPPLQHLVKITTPYFTSDPAWDSQNAFLLNYYPATTFLPGHENESCWGAGPKDPFLGHRTSSGTLLPTARMVEQDPILSKIRTNLELISWTDRKGPDRDGQIITSNCPQLLEHIVKSYTSLDIRDLSHFGATHTYGTIDHHLAERKFKSTIARNTLSNVYTQYDGDSTYNKRISRAPGHYYINYLAIFCHGVMTTSLPLCFEPTLVLPPQMWLVVNPCSVCCRPIRETPIFMDLAPIATLRPPKLLTTAVGKRALGLLREAVEEFNSRDFRDIPTDASLTVEDATLGILQEMVDHTQSDKRRLEERYTDHNLTESGQKTLSALQPRTISAGFTHHEFNTLSPEHMLGPICSIVYDYCNLMFTGVCSDRIAEYISQLPIEQLPWYSIISKLYAMNLLKLFLKVVERRRGVRAGVAYVNVLHATSYLAEACLYLTERWVVPPSCVYLTHYHLSKFKLHFSRSLRFAFKTWMNIRIDPLLRESHDAIRRGGPTTEMFERALRSHITLIGMMLSCEIFQEDHINDLLQDLEENGVIISPFINSSDLDYDIYQEAEEVRRENGLDALMIRYPELPWGSIDALEEEEFSTNLINLHDLTSSFRMRIVCTTSLDCVNTLKSYVPEDTPEEEDLEDLMQKILDFSILPKPTLEAKPGQVLEVPKSSFTGALVRPRIDPLSFTDSKLILDRSLLFRPYGDATLAISKQCEIWCRMNMPKTVERPLSIAVFGDGLGGTSTFYTVVAPGSHLLLVTLPDKPGDNGIPPLTETYARRYGCTLDGHLVAEETSDVSKIETMRKIEVSPRTYDLVISDIEYKWIESCESYIIMNNICVFYLRRRSLDGILIAQVKLSEPNVIYAMCRILVPHCQHVRVLKIRSSTRHEQAYLVAWGSTKVFVGDYNIPASGESTRVYDAIFKFVARCHQNYVSECDHTNIALDIRSLSWPYHKHWVGILPYKLEISMYKRLAVRMDFYSLSCLIKTQPNLASVYAVSLPESIDRQIAETLEYFDSSRHPHIRHLTSDMNTRKHAQRTYERFLLLKGFRDSYTTLSSPTGVRVTDIMIRTMYKEILVTAPARLRIPAVSGAHFKSKMMVDKIKISPYSHYFSGWTIGIEFCSLITMLYKYRDRL